MVVVDGNSNLPDEVISHLEQACLWLDFVNFIENEQKFGIWIGVFNIGKLNKAHKVNKQKKFCPWKCGEQEELAVSGEEA